MKNLTGRINKHVKTAIKIFVSAAALLFVLYKIDFSDVIKIYKQVQVIYLVPATLLFVFSKVFSSFRLNLFLRGIQIRLSQDSNLKLYLLGMFYNLFLPGGIGGDGYKIYILNKKTGVKAPKIFWAVFMDRLNGMLALFLLAVALVYFIDFLPSYKMFLWLLIPLSLFVFYMILKRFFPCFTGIYLKTNLQSLGVQLLQVACALFLLLALNNKDGSPQEYLFLFLLSSIVATLPITIGGIGSREITFLYGAKMMNLDVNISIALSLMFYLITAFVSSWGIYYSINRPRLVINSTRDDGNN